jgi:glycosyltransferase involved in cell wall biosynthesis
MNYTPLISVAIATYNGGQFLKDQLNSIYNQTYKNIEVIITDDCSTDGTLEILEEYSQKYGLNYYINEKNLGVVKNFERALSLCGGEYIALADQDDIWLPEKIQNLVNEIGNYSLIFSDAILVDTYGNKIAESLKKVSNYIADTETPFLQLFYRKNIYGCTMFFRKELLQKALPIPDDVGQHDWWLPIVAAKNRGIKYLDRRLMFYRQHKNNISGDVKDHIIFYKLLRLFMSEHREKRKKFRARIKKDIEASLNSSLPLEDDERVMLTGAIYYFDSFLKNEINMKVLFTIYKYRDFLFSKRKYFVLEIIHRVLHKVLKL